MSSATEHLGPFTVVELRRYTIVGGERPAFATYFESFFPEAFQQLGALALGHFLERQRADTFTWLRAFTDMDAHARVKSAFYYGPLWKEHRSTMNDRLLDWRNALLLRPLRPETGVPVLPALDPVRESAGTRGVVAMQIFAVQAGAAEEFARRAEPVLAGYAAAGARPAGLLVTLDAANNFPQHPVREDGPFVVWLGILPDEPAATEYLRLAAQSGEAFGADWLREAPESVLLDPARRSRLRWLPD